MASYRLQTALGYHPGDTLADPLLDGDGNVIAPAGELDPAKWERWIGVDGLRGFGIVYESETAPTDSTGYARADEVLAVLHEPTLRCAHILIEEINPEDGSQISIVVNVSRFR